jgi:putative salt-induced outer membrane protein YdiY
MRKASFLLLFLAMPSVARADDAPKGLGTGVDAASKGETNVAKEGFVGAEKKEDPEKNRITDVSVNIGALLAAGNSRNLALTAATKAKIRRDAHQFGGSVALNYAQAGKSGEATTTSVENLQGMLRYDFYLTERLSVFLKVAAMHDRFQGLDVRFNLDPGVAYAVINEKDMRLWGELGYDFIYDVRRNDALLQKDGSMLDKTVANHGMRTFVGWDHKLNENVAILAGMEYLQAFTDTNAWRLNGDASLKANLTKRFAIATSLQVRYDHASLPGKEHTDMLTSVSLNYSLF